MRFVKMHGCGNDFVMFNGFQEAPIEKPGVLAAAVCRRGFGIGADGLILCLPAKNGDFEMRIFNVDGSEAEMCGNGIRCAAIFAQQQGITDKNELEVVTKAGIIRPKIIKNTPKEKLVRVDMGKPHLKGVEIPCTLKGDRLLEQPIEVGEEDYLFSAVSMGNPHCVIFIDGKVAKFPVTTVGPKIEAHPYFPAKTNVEFVEVMDDHNVKMRVWERGCGETLACGTGACATAVAAILSGRCQDYVYVELNGGTLEIEYQEGGRVYMTGPVEKVFSGEI